MARGATYSRPCQPPVATQPVSTGSTPFYPFLPPRTPSGLHVPPCASKGVSPAPVSGPLFQFSIPTVFRPISADSTSSPALLLSISRVPYIRCPAFAVQPASSSLFLILSPRSQLPSQFSAPQTTVATGSSAVATGCSSDDPGRFSEDPGRSSEGSAASPKVSPMNSVART